MIFPDANPYLLTATAIVLAIVLFIVTKKP